MAQMNLELLRIPSKFARCHDLSLSRFAQKPFP